MRWGLAVLVFAFASVAPAAAQTDTTTPTVPPTTAATTPTTDAPATTQATVPRTTVTTQRATTSRPTTTSSTSSTTSTTLPVEEDDNGENVDVGVLGLAGLVGLLGLGALLRARPAPRPMPVATERVTDRTLVIPHTEQAAVDETSEIVVYENLSYEELLAEAQAAGISGFSAMTREELIQALRSRG